MIGNLVLWICELCNYEFYASETKYFVHCHKCMNNKMKIKDKI